MAWSVAFAVLILALLIPILVVVFDAPFLHRQRPGNMPAADDRMDLLASRLLSLEDEVDDLALHVRELRDELQDVQRLLDAGRPPGSPNPTASPGG